MVPQFIYLFIRRHLGCFQVWAIVNKAAIASLCRILCGAKFSATLVNAKEHSCWIHMVKSMFGFLRNFQAIFWSDYMILISPNNEWESSCCTLSSPTFSGVSVLDFSHSNSCFNLHFSADMWFGTSFHMLIYFRCIIFFSEVSMKVPGSFFNWFFFFLLILRVLCTFSITVLLQLFSPVLWFVLSSSWHCLSWSRSFKF